MIHTHSDIQENLNLECDAVVVGSGAGGAPVAMELAKAGHHVILLEEGGAYATPDFRVDDTIGSTAKLYRDGGGSLIFGKPNILLAEGRVLGGSTLMNGGMCWRTPEKILKRWEWEFGLTDYTPEKLDPIFLRVEKMIHAKPMIPEARNRDGELLRDGAKNLGYAFKANVRSQDRCVGSNMCLYGCPTGAKQTTANTYVPEFLKSGGIVYCHVRVRKVLTCGGRAVGVEGVVVHPETKKKLFKVRVKAPIVVIAGGAIQTPALLLRSGIRDASKQLGRNLITHPNVKVMATFPERVDGWKGVIQGYQIDEFFDEGILMAVNFVPPGIMALALPLPGGKIIQTLKEEYHHTVMGGALIEDCGGGGVYAGPFDSAIPVYNITPEDFRKAIRAIALLSEVFFAAGAKKCYLPLTGMSEIHSIDEIAKIYERKWRPIDLELLTVHVMGTCRMGADPKRSVVGPACEFHNVSGLFVPDASVFPTSIGVNPQVTIMTIATKCADYINENFSRYEA